MGLLTDDCDINQNELETFIGGNGDFYIAIKAEGKSYAVRIATSGGIAPLDVKLAIANLHREMEAAGLNSPTKKNELVIPDVSGHVPAEILDFLHKLRLAEHSDIREHAIDLFSRYCR